MSAEVTALMLGETAGAEAARVEAHLAECPACRREADETRALLTRLRSLPQERVTRDLAPEILSRIPVRQWAPSLRILGLPVAYAWAAAAAVVLLIGGIAPFVRSARHAAPSPAPEAMTSDTAMDRAVV
jgi:anti-sigma factor RsiW